MWGCENLSLWQRLNFFNCWNNEKIFVKETELVYF